MRHTHKAVWCLLASASLANGCTGDEPTPIPSGLPDEVTMVANEGFDSPLDVVASPDGSTFYFTAFTVTDEPEAAVFRVAADGSGTASAIHTGAPLSMPTGLLMNCDGSQLILADMSRALDDESDEAEEVSGGSLYTVDVATGTVSALDAAGVHEPSGLALSFDCKTLYATGWTEDGIPALFRLPLSGGQAEVVYEGAPLLSPTGMYVDKDEVAWVLDHIAGPAGEGVLYAITAAGELSSVAEGLGLGAPGGCSLNSAADTAFIPTRGADGAALTSISLADGAIRIIDTPDVVDPAGLRSARDAAVFGLVDHEGNAIYRVQ